MTKQTSSRSRRISKSTSRPAKKPATTSKSRSRARPAQSDVEKQDQYSSKRARGNNHDVMEAKVDVPTVQLPIGPVSIFNFYNPGRWHPGQSVLPALDQAIQEAPGRHYIVVGDFNLHHSMWDHDKRPHQDTRTPGMTP
ncbi:hypothetical protein BJX70DRAFT_404764 [Aspergillus crustosus]